MVIIIINEAKRGVLLFAFLFFDIEAGNVAQKGGKVMLKKLLAFRPLRC